jgi:hypothetical protein
LGGGGAYNGTEPSRHRGVEEAVAKVVGTVAEEEPVMAQSQAGGGPRRPGWGRPDALTSKGGGGGGGWRPRCRRGGLGSGSVGARGEFGWRHMQI